MCNAWEEIEEISDSNLRGDVAVMLPGVEMADREGVSSRRRGVDGALAWAEREKRTETTARVESSV